MGCYSAAGNQWTDANISLAAYAGQTVRLALLGVGKYGNRIFIDRFHVTTATVWTGTMWTDGVPTSTSRAIIAGNYSNGSFTTDDLILNSGVAFMPTGDIDIKGTVTNNGATIGGAGFITYSGAGVQTIAGNFMKLKVNNAAGATITGPTTVSGVLKLENGTLTTNNNLTPGQCFCLSVCLFRYYESWWWKYLW